MAVALYYSRKIQIQRLQSLYFLIIFHSITTSNTRHSPAVLLQCSPLNYHIVEHSPGPRIQWQPETQMVIQKCFIMLVLYMKQ